jgi:phosphate-selective porin OprO and OprP
MHGWTNRCLACLLAGTMICAASAAWAQDGGFPAEPMDPAYAVASGQYGTAAEVPATEANYNNASMLGEKDLAKEVANLKETVQKLADKAEADKKKAAECPTVKVGGFVFVDSTWFGQNPASIAALGNAQDTTYFRNARINFEGEYGITFYKIEYDFTGRTDFTTGAASAGTAHTHTISAIEQTPFKDVYAGVKDLPFLGRIQAGHFKEPFGLEELTSDKYTTFTERGFTSTFTPSRNIGVMAINNWAGENGTWALGTFRTMGDAPPFIADDRGMYAATGRVTFLPWYDEATEGRGLWHVGAAYSYRDYSGTTLTVSSRPEVGTGPNVVSTSSTALTNVACENMVGLETAFVYGPLSLQAEYIGATFNRTGGLGAPYLSAGYAYASYFLTGEHRVYRRDTGCFSRVKPRTNFFRVRTEDGCIETGSGAWEVGYRWSFINLDNSGILGGYASDHTFGLTWYMTPYMKVMADLVHSDDSTQNNGPNTFIDCVTLRTAFEY